MPESSITGSSEPRPNLLSGALIVSVMCLAALVATAVSAPVDMEQLAPLFVEEWRGYLVPEPIERQPT